MRRRIDVLLERLLAVVSMVLLLATIFLLVYLFGSPPLPTNLSAMGDNGETLPLQNAGNNDDYIKRLATAN